MLIGNSYGNCFAVFLIYRHVQCLEEDVLAESHVSPDNASSCRELNLILPCFTFISSTINPRGFTANAGLHSKQANKYTLIVIVKKKMFFSK